MVENKTVNVPVKEFEKLLKIRRNISNIIKNMDKDDGNRQYLIFQKNLIKEIINRVYKSSLSM